MKTKILIAFVFILFWNLPCFSQDRYTVDASNVMITPETGHFKMGNPGPDGKKIEINSLYMTIGGKPVLPVMGEVHFSRIKKEQWEDCILKMKACGINIISTYLFWNHHEEIEGQFNWEGDKDIRAFIILCRKYDLYACVRIGPWSHGEMRNGGTPDWILRKKYITDRSNDPVYQSYVVRYFSELAKQLDGLYYKDEGNIIAVQLENEYWYAQKGEPHIEWLKKTALELGMDVPLYTVTGWGGGSVPPFEVIPLWGGYADEPWIEKVTRNILPYNFMFDSFRDNKHIGNDQVKHEKEYMTYERYPYFTCEMGVGIQNTYHRRLVINEIDGLGMMTAKLGSGSNLLGYYMFAGGTNPHGELHGTEEEQEETGYWSRVPAKSYDFQAAIKESGELNGAYKQVKKLHYFVNDFGDQLAPMMPVLGKSDENNLQFAVRSNNHAAFLFGINYCRYVPKNIRKEVRFEVQLNNETLRFPQKGVNIPDSAVFIWPLNLPVKTALLKYATAQLLCKTEDTYVFYRNRTIEPEFAFDASSIEKVSLPVSKGQAVNKDGLIVVGNLLPGKDCILNVEMKDGSAMKILLLTEQEADNTWLFERNGKKEFLISQDVMYDDGKDVYVFSRSEADKKIRLRRHSILSGAQWPETANFKDILDHQQRYHRFFYKEFSLENPSGFRKATLYIYPETGCSLNINDQWVRQAVASNRLNIIDITGYIRKGGNSLLLDFPYTEGQKKFSARVIIEYSNYDRVEFSSDQSWLATDQYTPPSPMKPFYDKPQAPVIVPAPDYAKDIKCPDFEEWDIFVPYGVLDGLSAIYLHLSYKGDRMELYNGYRLCGDHFNDNTTWSIGLQRIQPQVEGQTLRLILYPLSKKTKVFFDVPLHASDYETTGIEKFEVVAEYKVTVYK